MTLDLDRMAGWRLKPSPYESFTAELRDDSAKRGKRVVAIVRDHRDAKMIVGAVSRLRLLEEAVKEAEGALATADRIMDSWNFAPEGPSRGALQGALTKLRLLNAEGGA